MLPGLCHLVSEETPRQILIQMNIQVDNKLFIPITFHDSLKSCFSNKKYTYCFNLNTQDTNWTPSIFYKKFVFILEIIIQNQLPISFGTDVKGYKFVSVGCERLTFNILLQTKYLPKLKGWFLHQPLISCKAKNDPKVIRKKFV